MENQNQNQNQPSPFSASRPSENQYRPEPSFTPPSPVEEPVSSGGGYKIVVTLVVILLVSLGLYWFLLTPGSINSSDLPASPLAGIDDETAGDTENPNRPQLPDSPILSLTVSDQEAGAYVSIDSVAFTGPSWVAVEDNLNGQRGNTLGALWLPAGTHVNQDVELLRPTISGRSYFVVLRSDSTNDHIFNRQDDPELLDESGDILITTFTAR